MNLRQAAQRALDWLEDDTATTVDEAYRRERQIADALRAALAEPEQEPVALPCCGYANASAVKWNPHNQVVQCHNCGQIYTAPTPHKPQTTHWEGCEAVHPECRKPDTVIALAREAGSLQDGLYFDIDVYSLERFAALVAKAERDRICEMLRERHKQEERHNYYGFIANMIEEQK